MLELLSRGKGRTSFQCGGCVYILLILVGFSNILFSSTQVRHLSQQLLSSYVTFSAEDDYNTTRKYYEVLVVVPGLGDMNRFSILNKSLLALENSMEKSKSGFRCLIYVYEQRIWQNASQAFQQCNLVYNEGLWTHHMKQVPNAGETTTTTTTAAAAAAAATMGTTTTTTHVALLLDDVDVSSINMTDFLHTMTQANYSMASASTRWSNHKVPMTQREECISHRSDFADILFAVFQLDAWLCWQNQIDLDINKMGWGYDVTFHQLCKASVGVIDTALFKKLRHGKNGATYNWNSAAQQMHRWIEYVQNYTDEEDAKKYFHHIAKEKVKLFPRCDLNRTQQS